MHDSAFSSIAALVMGESHMRTLAPHARYPVLADDKGECEERVVSQIEEHLDRPQHRAGERGRRRRVAVGGNMNVNRDNSRGGRGPRSRTQSRTKSVQAQAEMGCVRRMFFFLLEFVTNLFNQHPPTTNVRQVL